MAEFKSLVSGEQEAQFRQLLSAFFTISTSPLMARTGVLGASGLRVAQTTTASAAVTVDAGVAIVQSSVSNGVTPLVCDTPKTLDVLTANPLGGLPRNDVVVFDGTVGAVSVITGTPAAVPTDPTVPATAVPLARLRHAASATNVPTSAIDDLRVFTAMRGGLVNVRNQAERDAMARDTTMVYRSDTDAIEVYDGTNWDTWTPGRWKKGRATVTVNGTGYATITHGAGFTPSDVFCQPEFAYLCGVDQDTITATTFQVRLLTADGLPVSGATKVSFTCYE